DRLEILGQLDTVNDHATLLPVLDAVDAAEQRRFAAARWPADHDALAAHHLEFNVAQHVKAAKPLVQVDDFDRDLIPGGAHGRRDALARRTTRNQVAIEIIDLN